MLPSLEPLLGLDDRGSLRRLLTTKGVSVDVPLGLRAQAVLVRVHAQSLLRGVHCTGGLALPRLDGCACMSLSRSST